MQLTGEPTCFILSPGSCKSVEGTANQAHAHRILGCFSDLVETPIWRAKASPSSHPKSSNGESWCSRFITRSTSWTNTRPFWGGQHLRRVSERSLPAAHAPLGFHIHTFAELVSSLSAMKADSKADQQLGVTSAAPKIPCGFHLIASRIVYIL